MKKVTIIVIVFAALFVGSCGPSEEEMAIALAQTLTAMATNTHTPKPTATSTLTPTVTPTFTMTYTLTPSDTPTLTPTPTFTPSPTPDVRVIELEPYNFLLEADDLPPEGKYFMPGGWKSPHLNSEIISGWGTEDGKEYLANTGRVTGYWIRFVRGTRTVQMPDIVYCGIIQYKTAEGAQLIITNYSRALTSRGGYDWKRKEVEIQLGDINEVVYRKKTLKGGEITITYFVNFAYRNYVAECYGYGLETDVSHEFVENVARAILEKFMQATLVDPEIASFNQ